MSTPKAVSQAAIQRIYPHSPQRPAQGTQQAGGDGWCLSGTAGAHLQRLLGFGWYYSGHLSGIFWDNDWKAPEWQAWWGRRGRKPIQEASWGLVSVSVGPTCEKEPGEVGCCPVLDTKYQLTKGLVTKNEAFVPSVLTSWFSSSRVAWLSPPWEPTVFQSWGYCPDSTKC